MQSGYWIFSDTCQTNTSDIATVIGEQRMTCKTMSGCGVVIAASQPPRIPTGCISHSCRAHKRERKKKVTEIDTDIQTQTKRRTKKKYRHRQKENHKNTQTHTEINKRREAKLQAGWFDDVERGAHSQRSVSSWSSSRSLSMALVSHTYTSTWLASGPKTLSKVKVRVSYLVPALTCSKRRHAGL